MAAVSNPKRTRDGPLLLSAAEKPQCSAARSPISTACCSGLADERRRVNPGCRLVGLRARGVTGNSASKKIFHFFPIQSGGSGVVAIVNRTIQSTMKSKFASFLKQKVNPVLFAASCLMLVYLGLTTKVKVNDLAAYEDDRTVLFTLFHFDQRLVK